MTKVKYMGCFFEAAELENKLKPYNRTPLYRTITLPHVTFSFMPKFVPLEMFGKPITIRAIEYGCNDENEALFVEFVSLPKELESIANDIPVPHITLSVSKEGKAVNSSKLKFTPIAPFELQGVFGAVDMENKLYTKI